MDDLHAFERQVERRIQRFVGPIQPVDDLAIFDAVNATTRSHKWGFTMFSTLRLVAAGAILALFGSFLLSGVLTGPATDDVSSAAITSSPTPIQEGRSEKTKQSALVYADAITMGAKSASQTIARPDGSMESIGERYMGAVSDMSDPRLNGKWQVAPHEITYDGNYHVVTAAVRIDNEDGSWVGSSHGYIDTTTAMMYQQDLLAGSGAYEGLTAVLFWGADPEHQVIGIIVPGEMPEVPELPSPTE